jgi:hypothetical protein
VTLSIPRDSQLAVFLLEAEPQIGKTGTALWVAIKLHQQVTQGCLSDDANLIQEIPSFVRLQVKPNLCHTPLQWKYPYGVMCRHQTTPKYSNVRSGKYHLRVFVSRLRALSAVSKSPGWAKAFESLICQQEDVRLGASEREKWLKQFSQLSLDTIVRFADPASKPVSFQVVSGDTLLRVVDWDGRLKRYESKNTTANELIPHFTDAVACGLLIENNKSSFTFVCLCSRLFYHVDVFFQ